MVYSYTDNHNVDEDMATIIDYGGNWNNWDISVASGVMCRVMNDTFIDTYVSVAFAQKNK